MTWTRMGAGMALAAVLSACTGRVASSSGGVEERQAQAPQKTSESRSGEIGKMNAHLQLYTWVRGGASIYLAHVLDVLVQPAAGPDERLTITLQIEETLHGEQGAAVRRIEQTRLASKFARAKTPDPVWGAVDPKQGARLLIAARPGPNATLDPVHVEAVADPGDPVLAATRGVLVVDKASPVERRAAYLRWLTAGGVVERMFAMEAFAHDKDLPDIDPKGDVAAAFAGVIIGEADLAVRWSAGELAWRDILPRAGASGKVAIINATLSAAVSGPDNLRTFALDRFAMADLALVRQPGVTASPEALAALEKRRDQEAPEVRPHVQQVIDALRAAPKK